MLGLRGHKYQQTCHSPRETNLNGYEKKIWMISQISSSPSPLSLIFSVANERYASGRTKSPPSRYRGVGISTVQKKKTHTHTQLASKKPISQGWEWDWPFKKAEKLRTSYKKWLKRTVVNAEGGSSFQGVWEHAPPEKFWKFLLQMRPFRAILHHS